MIEAVQLVLEEANIKSEIWACPINNYVQDVIRLLHYNRIVYIETDTGQPIIRLAEEHRTNGIHTSYPEPESYIWTHGRYNLADPHSLEKLIKDINNIDIAKEYGSDP